MAEPASPAPHPLAEPRIRRRLLVLAAATPAALLAHLWMNWAALAQSGDPTLPIDYRTFWVAGQFLLQGQPLAVFDRAAMEAAMALSEDRADLPWLYPPATLLLLAPFASLPFLASWAALALASLAALAAALARGLPGPRALRMAALLSPAFIPCLGGGHLTMLWCAGLVAALAAHEAGRPVLAGVLIGCLTLKPQLGLAIPVVLLAVGAWRTILAAGATTAVLALAPLAVTGVAYWPELLDALALRRAEYLAEAGDLTLMIGLYPLLAWAGVPAGTAQVVHWLFALPLLACVAVIWRSPRAGPEIRAAALFAVCPMVAPFVWQYDAALLSLAAAWLAAARIGTETATGRGLLVAIWLNAMLLIAFAGAVPLSLACLPLALAALALAGAACTRGAAGLSPPRASG